MKRFRALFALACAVLPAAAQDDWSRFRGPDGSGVAREGAALPAALDPESNLAWELATPAGHSSPVVWGERMFLTGHEGEELVTLCVDRKSGELLWRRAVVGGEAERYQETSGPASPTPAVDAARVVVAFGEVGLIAYDHGGEQLWRRALPAPSNTFGSAASPVFAGGHLVHLRDANDGSFLEALDPATGKPRWRVEREGFASGWSTPGVRRIGDVTELLVYGVSFLTAYELTGGAVRWSVPGLADEPIVVPVAGDGLVYVTSYNMGASPEVQGLPTFAAVLAECDANGDGAVDAEEARTNRSVLSRFDADGEGDHPLRIFFRFLDVDRDGLLVEGEWGKLVAWLGSFEQANGIVAIRPGEAEAPAEVAWQFERGVPECPSPLLYRERVWCVKNGGLATCLDAATGAPVFEGRLDARGPRYSSPVAGDGKVFAISARGVATVLEAADELRVLSRTDLGERVTATPALVDGTVLVRTEGRLLCFGLDRH